MRYNRDDLPEIRDAYERDGFYFGIVSVTRGRESRTFEFGVKVKAYSALKRILGMRPFDRMPGAQYRYFFVPTVGVKLTAFPKNGRPRGSVRSDKLIASIRIEQGRLGKQFDVEAPRELIANLLWFYEMKDLAEAGHLCALERLESGEWKRIPQGVLRIPQEISDPDAAQTEKQSAELRRPGPKKWWQFRK
jgi:hypothetical protein